VRETLIRMDEVRRERARLIAERDEALGQRNDALVALESMRSALEEGRKTKELQEAQIAALTFQLTTSEEELASVKGEIADLNDQVKISQRQVNLLQEERDRLNRQLEEIKAQTEAQAAENARLASQIKEKESRVAELDAEIQRLQSRIALMSATEPKVLEGQQLGAFRIRTDLDQQAMQERLGTQLAALRDTYRDPLTGEAVLSGNELVIRGEDFVQAIKSIRSLPSDEAVVIAYATANVYGEEDVTIRVEVTSYYKVYATGSVIFSEVFSEPVSGTDPHRAAVASFMEDARDYLVDKRNLIPTSSGDVLQLTYDDMVSLSDKLAKVGYPAKIDMVALKDIFRTDFLVYGEHFTVNISKATSSGAS